MDFCSVVKYDVFDISNRLKQIDKGYFVVRNHKKQRFEVHNRLQRGGSFCIAVPYPRLDQRTLDLIRRTRFERAQSFLKELEEDNKRAQRAAVAEAVKNAEKSAEQALSGLK